MEEIHFNGGGGRASVSFHSKDKNSYPLVEFDVDVFFPEKKGLGGNSLLLYSHLWRCEGAK